MTDQPPLTLADIKAIRARAKVATPGPWAYEQCGEKCDVPVVGLVMGPDDKPIAGRFEQPLDTSDDAYVRWPIALEFVECDGRSASSNAAHIAGLDPLTVVALCDLAEAHLRQTAEPVGRCQQKPGQPFPEGCALGTNQRCPICEAPLPTNAIAVVERMRDEWSVKYRDLKEAGFLKVAEAEWGLKIEAADILIAALKEEGL